MRFSIVFFRSLILLVAFTSVAAHAQMRPITAPPVDAFAFEEDFDKKNWQELELRLPPPPEEANLLPFFVSPTATQNFRIDSSSLSVGSDGVIRYVVVVTSSAGGRNVSFEGLRCATGERRLYAFGRSDGSWSKARASRWEPVDNKVINRYHAALMRDYFCPGGMPIRSAAEGVAVLKSGGYVSGGP